MNAALNEQVAQPKKSGFFAALMEYLDVRVLDADEVLATAYNDKNIMHGYYNCGSCITGSEFVSNVSNKRLD